MCYKYLLLDADDTLFDFQKAQDLSLNEVFETLHIDPKHKALYKEISHHLWAQLERQEITLDDLKQLRFTRLLAALNIKTDIDVEMLYETTLASHDELIDGAKDFLKRIASDYHLILISNGMPNIQHPRLTSTHLKQYFEAIFISDEIGAQKPSKEFFDYVFTQINVKKEECLIIGDSLTSDIQGGVNYHIDTCWLNFEGKKHPLPTYCCGSYEDILNILDTKKEPFSR